MCGSEQLQAEPLYGKREAVSERRSAQQPTIFVRRLSRGQARTAAAAAAAATATRIERVISDSDASTAAVGRATRTMPTTASSTVIRVATYVKSVLRVLLRRLLSPCPERRASRTSGRLRWFSIVAGSAWESPRTAPSGAMIVMRVSVSAPSSLAKLVEGSRRGPLLRKRPHEVLHHLGLGGQVRLDALPEVVLHLVEDVQPEGGEGDHDEQDVSGGGAKAEAPQHP